MPTLAYKQHTIFNEVVSENWENDMDGILFEEKREPIEEFIHISLQIRGKGFTTI